MIEFTESDIKSGKVGTFNNTNNESSIDNFFMVDMELSYDLYLGVNSYKYSIKLTLFHESKSKYYHFKSFDKFKNKAQQIALKYDLG